MSSIKRDYDNIHSQPNYEKDAYIDKLYNELLFAHEKIKKLGKRYRKAKKIAKDNFDILQRGNLFNINVGLYRKTVRIKFFIGT